MIGGPTASGKSSLAFALAREFGGAIINADSMQVYAELRILTARPSPEDERRVPHYLYGTVPAVRRYSVGLWLETARRTARDCLAAGGPVLVVGGTGFYLDALIRGLSPIPDVPDAIRADVLERTRELDPGRLHDLAMTADADLAKILPEGDTQRLVRLIEVFEATGEPLSAWQRRPRRDGWPGPVLFLVLEPDRQDLYAACNARFDAMLAAGALDEVRMLAEKDLNPELPAMRALGVPHLLAHVRGDKSLEDAITASKTATRRFAKRQMTWFRHQAPDSRRLTEVDPAKRLESSRSHIARFLLTEKGPKA